MAITFIGGGNMASALIAGMLAKAYPVNSLRAVEISEAKRDWLRHEFGITVVEKVDKQLTNSDCIVLAVKPQNLCEVAKELQPYLAGQLLISIAAGIRTGDLSRWLTGYANIIRAMPNTPALVAVGFTALYALASVGGEQKRLAEDMFSSVGSILWIDDEAQMDAVTAISGSGPGYVFYFIEALQDAALRMGFSNEQARGMAIETFYGAATMAKQSPEDVSILRSRVTSKGGTTEAALTHMQDKALKQIIVDAAKQAERRSQELGCQLADQK